MTFNPRRAVVMIEPKEHKFEDQSVQKDRVKTNGRTDGHD